MLYIHKTKASVLWYDFVETYAQTGNRNTRQIGKKPNRCKASAQQCREHALPLAPYFHGSKLSTHSLMTLRRAWTCSPKTLILSSLQERSTHNRRSFFLYHSNTFLSLQERSTHKRRNFLLYQLKHLLVARHRIVNRKSMSFRVCMSIWFLIKCARRIRNVFRTELSFLHRE